MHIDYKIIWLDDNIQDFEKDEHIEDVKKYLTEKGFNPKVDTYSNHQEFLNSLNDTYDLILTDYHMDKMNGDKVIETIRKDKGIFTEILFYTAKADLKDTDKIDRVSFLETSKNQSLHHETIINKIKELIDLSLKKFNDIVVMRGMIINEVSSMDETKLDIIKHYINYKEDTLDLKNNILQKAEEHFNKKIGNIKEWKDDSKNGFKLLIKDNFIFSSDYKIETISYIAKKLNQKDFTNEYKEEIIKTRNKFAHSKLIEEKQQDGQIKRYFKHGEEGITFDDEYCQKIRKNITKHKNHLEGLKNSLNGLPENSIALKNSNQ